MEMGVCDGRMEKRHILHGAAMKFGTGKGCPVKGGLFDPAYGKGAVAEPGKVKIRMIGYAVERHPVKIGFTEKARRKTVLCRPVVKPLVNDLQRAFLAGVKYLVVVLLAAALGIRLGQKLFLRLKIRDTLPEHRPVSVVVRPAAAYRVHPGEQFVNRVFTPALQDVVDGTDGLGCVPRRILVGSAYRQIKNEAPAYVQAAAYCLKIAYGMFTSLRSSKCVSP